LGQGTKEYTAEERAATFNLSYEQYRRLGLRRSGCAEKSKEERRRLTYVQVRLQPKQFARLDAWIRKQSNSPTRPEAIGSLLEKALAK
jgi:hypothetical protein